MNREFENSGREMPYRLPPQSLEALHERILSVMGFLGIF